MSRALLLEARAALAGTDQFQRARMVREMVPRLISALEMAEAAIAAAHVELNEIVTAEVFAMIHEGHSTGRGAVVRAWEVLDSAKLALQDVR